MITQEDKDNDLANARALSVDLANDYLQKSIYGFPDADKCLNRLSVIHTLIREIERYQIADCNDFFDWGVLNLGGKKITLSENNSLPSSVGNQKYQIQNNDINCITEEEYCKILSRIETFSQGCSC